MKSMIVVLGALFSSFAFAGVENILSMQRDSSGAYSVVCDLKGVVSHSVAVTADAIRTDQVCAEDVQIGQLEAGHYKTDTDFCGQTVQWNGAQLNLVLDSPCSGTVSLDLFQGNWYRGKLPGYEFVYEVQVTGPQKYTFYSRDFGTQGDFVKGLANWLPSAKAKRSADPSRN